MDSQTANAVQEDIDQLRALYRSLKIPEHLLKSYGIASTDVFDVNEVFGIFDHLKMVPGYILDYAYFGGNRDGYPVLYARRIDQDRSLYRLPAHPGQGEVDPEFDPFSHNPLSAIQADGSAEGYMQLVVFARMGSQFYLHWHANYDDFLLIATPEALEEIVTDSAKNEFGYPLDASMQAKALRIDPAPELVWTDNRVTVSILYFTKWGGIFRADYQMNRTFPHQMIMMKDINLLDYDCGIMF